MNISTFPLAIPVKPKFNYNQADWEKFSDHMNSFELPNIINKHSTDIDTLWDKLIQHIKTGANLYIPKTSYKIIPALNQSNRTKALLRIYQNRHEIYKLNITPERAQILNNIKQHIKSSLYKDLCDYWSRRIDQIEENKLVKDPKNMYNNIRKLMGTKNRNLGTYLIHRGKEIHNHQDQADLFVETWEKVMKPNSPRDTPEIHRNIEDINNWIEQNQQNIKPLPHINLNTLDKSNSLTKPITISEVSQSSKRLKVKLQARREFQNKY